MVRTIISNPTVSQMKPHALRGFHAALAKWYRTHGRRDLPWRNTRDPYHIWLSEVMLQQTQVATVRDRFYFPFLEKFPSLEALARADITEVIKAWEGLGYYSRARNLHAAARTLCATSLRGAHELSVARQPKKRRSNPASSKKSWIASRNQHRASTQTSGPPRNDAVGGVALPNRLEALLALPGIGKNTAHAILAFAYHRPVAILEANVKRVVARVFALETPSDAQLWQAAEILLNRRDPFDYNQAMMDVGARVCTPKNPHCGACPAHSICKGKAAPETYPAPKAKKQVPTREMVIHVREDARGRLYLEKREAKLLGGLYGFPQISHLSPVTCHQKKRRDTDDRRLATGDFLGTVTHSYSHFKLIGQVVFEKIDATPNSKDWHSREEIARLPLSKLDHKVLALVDKCNSRQKKKRESRVLARAH